MTTNILDAPIAGAAEKVREQQDVRRVQPGDYRRAHGTEDYGDAVRSGRHGRASAAIPLRGAVGEKQPHQWRLAHGRVNEEHAEYSAVDGERRDQGTVHVRDGRLRGVTPEPPAGPADSGQSAQGGGVAAGEKACSQNHQACDQSGDFRTDAAYYTEHERGARAPADTLPAGVGLVSPHSLWLLWLSWDWCRVGTCIHKVDLGPGLPLADGDVPADSKGDVPGVCGVVAACGYYGFVNVARQPFGADRRGEQPGQV